MDMFALGNIMAIQFVDRPEHILLGRYKYQHKFLYVLHGSGLVKLDHNLFNFNEGSLYAFRIANSIELITTYQLCAVIIIFNMIPFPDNRSKIGLSSQLRIADKINTLMPITSQTHEHQVQNQQDRESLSALLQIIKREISMQLEHSEEIILNSALNIVSMAVRISPNTVNQEFTIDQTSEIARISKYVQDKLKGNKKLTIAEISRGLTIPEYVLNKIFIKGAGITFADYLRKSKSEILMEN
jgi:hypothetical protein